MRVAILSTFPPRRCGIATFAADLHRSLCAAPGVTDVEVIAVDDKEVQSDTASIMTTVAAGRPRRLRPRRAGSSDGSGSTW